jgi:hypothetical protein
MTHNQPVQPAPTTGLVKGVAGFIVIKLLEALLKAYQRVVRLDNLVTGDQRNLAEGQSLARSLQWANSHFIPDDKDRHDDERKGVASTTILSSYGPTTWPRGRQPPHLQTTAYLGA